MQKKSAQVTIFDVATAAGVSIKTVSRVVNQEPNVAPKTRERVQGAIDQLGYQPNSAARGLSGKRSFVVGLVYENPNEFSYMKDILNGALEACDGAGYSLLLKPVVLPDPSLIERISDFVGQARLDGLILTAPLCDQAQLVDAIKGKGVQLACIAPSVPVSNAVNVIADDERACFEVTEFIINKGHTRIGFIQGHPDHGASHRRLDGYKKALRKHRIRYSKALVVQGYFDFESGRSGGAHLLELADPPTVIIAANDNMAAGVMYEGHERAKQIPGDLAVVGFDDTPIASQVWPPLTTVRQPILRMAKSAASELIKRMRDPALKPASETYRCTVIERQSTEHRLIR